MPLTFEDARIRQPSYPEKKVGPIIRFLIRHRVARDEQHATALLLIAVIAFFVIALGIFLFNIRKNLKESRVHYKFSKDLLQKLPQEIQIKILEQ